MYVINERKIGNFYSILIDNRNKYEHQFGEEVLCAPIDQNKRC